MSNFHLLSMRVIYCIILMHCCIDDSIMSIEVKHTPYHPLAELTSCSWLRINRCPSDLWVASGKRRNYDFRSMFLYDWWLSKIDLIDLMDLFLTTFFKSPFALFHKFIRDLSWEWLPSIFCNIQEKYARKIKNHRRLRNLMFFLH